MDTTQLPGGNYSATVRFTSNAPARSLLDVPVILRVPSRSQLLVTPAALSFPDTLLGTNATLSATLSNPGNLPLTISGLSTDDPAYTVSGISGGYFQLTSAAGTPITTFTSADLAGGLVQFVDDGNEVAPAFSVKVNDGDVDSNVLAATINYTPVRPAEYSAVVCSAACCLP